MPRNEAWFLIAQFTPAPNTPHGILSTP